MAKRTKRDYEAPDITVRRDGGLMSHNRTDGRTCVPAKWRQR